MEFLSTWQFWLGFTIGLFGGAIIGYFVAALCAVSGRASREEERMEETLTFNSKDVKPYKSFDDKKDTYGVATKNDPRSD